MNTRVDSLTTVNLIWQRKRIVSATVVVGAVLAFAASFLVAPVYEGRVVLLPITNNVAGAGSLGASQLGGLASLVGIGSADFSRKGEALARLESRQFVGSFLVEKTLLPLMYPAEWDAENGEWRSDDHPELADGVRMFLKERLKVTDDPASGVVIVRVSWTDRQLASDLANSLVHKLDSEMRTIAIDEAERSIEFLETLLKESTEIELRESIYRLIETQQELRMLARVGEGFVFKTIDPSLPPQEYERTKPKRVLMAILGGMTAFALCVFFVLASDWSESPRARRSES